jgi:uncharacterized membrane protein HdeD (DUF308 family)
MNDTGIATMKPSGPPHRVLDDIVSTTRHWWLLLITGTIWILVSVFLLRFDYTTVAAIAVLFGVFCLAAAASEFVVSAVSSSRGWRALHWILAALLVAVGIVAFVYPGQTFVAVAAMMSFYFVFRGTFDITLALAGSRTPGWWVLLFVGLIELALGFWAAGSWNASVVVLVSWVAAGALVHGIGEIATAFQIRNVSHGAASLETAARSTAILDRPIH